MRDAALFGVFSALRAEYRRIKQRHYSNFAGFD
jgi:predicted aminopeptidase